MEHQLSQLKPKKVSLSEPQEFQEKKEFLRKPTKSISGVTPITVVLPRKECWHGTCTFCPSHENVPLSYTPKSPSVISAIALNYDPYKQVESKIRNRELMGHATDKVELIIIGGTFLQYHVNYREEFIKKCFEALNLESSKTLEESQKINETAQHRCVALCIENRPDNCSIPQIEKMREYGATRVELGVQAADDEIYKLVNRGHTVEHVVDATERLKNAGFKVGYHIMPGLPGSNPQKDLELFKQLFSDPRFKPDQLKIYPCQVIDGAELEKDYWEGKYIPYTREQTEELLTKMMPLIPRYCRVMRVMREIPQQYLVDGARRVDVRKDVESDFRHDKQKLEEIRYREIGFAMQRNKKLDMNIELKTLEYDSSNGKEFFLEFVNKDDVLFGLLRLRFPNQTDLEELKDCAIIRELHVYGTALNLNEKDIQASQHQGLGKQLMQEAEKIAKEAGYKKLAVISGIGVKEYYRKLGYKNIGTYLVKNI